jgi:hypothetical protein
LLQNLEMILHRQQCFELPLITQAKLSFGLAEEVSNDHWLMGIDLTKAKRDSCAQALYVVLKLH